jgi:uncharacterized protein with PQ loop repeat
MQELPPAPNIVIAKSSATRFERLLYLLSIITIVMTIPQALTIWLNRTAEGVSVISWGTYLVTACVWFVHGIRQRDRTIYLACIGWIVLDAAIVVGALVFR